MRRTRWFLFIFLSLMLLLPAQAQRAPLSLAYVNSSGQLVVTSADGQARWIVTNPGETLHPVLGFNWAPDGARFFFAVGESLRVGDVAAQGISELGRLGGQLSGGEWDASGRIVLAAAGDASNPGAGVVLLPSSVVASPYMDERPNTPSVRASSYDGSAVFAWQSGGYVLRLSDGSLQSLPGRNDANARSSGFWSQAGPLVAYWGYDENGAATIYVAHPQGARYSLSGGSTPVMPMTWIPGTGWLLYRDATGQIRGADLTCALSSCSANPLESGLYFLPASASELQFWGEWAIYRNGEEVRALNIGCLDANRCENNNVLLGAQAAPRTMVATAFNTLIYTAHTGDPMNPNAREIRSLNLDCLLTSPGDCAPRMLLPNAVSGLLSPDGLYAVVDVAGSGLHILRLSDQGLIYLGSSGDPLGSTLTRARWNG